MNPPESPAPARGDLEEAARIYFLPNLMTALNLFCGFLAVIRCIQAKFASTHPAVLESLVESPEALYAQAVWFILAAVIFDSLDGRLARLGGRESLFGREFDSIADIVSFGMAPALLVFFLILSPTEEFPFFRQVGWLIGFIYLLCAAVRLARFNVITHPWLANPEGSRDFRGLPVPAAAGMISSIVLVINTVDLRHFAIFLPLLLILTSFLMVSSVRYPSFKKIGWSTELKFRSFIYFLIFVVLVYQFHYIAFAVLFLAYLVYGPARHFLRRESAGGEPDVNNPENNPE